MLEFTGRRKKLLCLIYLYQVANMLYTCYLRILEKNTMPESLVNQLTIELGNIDREIALLRERRDGIQKLLATYDPSSTANQDEYRDLPTIQLAVKVLEKNGAPMATAEIRRMIQRTFGVAPASSLQQMLYMRAMARKIFFNENKKYGLLAWKVKK
jgi:hypothetical protein